MLAPTELRVTYGETEGFTDRLLELINGGALAIMISIGHRTGLFDALIELGEVSSTELALATGLDARYVREWLGAMVVGRIVEHHAKPATYSLPDAHAAALCRKSGANLATLTQYLCVLAQVEDQIVECFRHGGGVPESGYPRVRAIAAEDSKQSMLPELESAILPLVPGLIDRMRLGIEVLELGCGRAPTLLQLAERFPRSRFHGVDSSTEALAWARNQARERGLRNLSFEQRDSAELGLEHYGRHDLITTFDAINEQRDVAATLAMIAESLAPGGVYLMQNIASSGHHVGDIGLPLGPLMYTLSCMRCVSVSLARGGAGLGTAWGRERTEAMLAVAGFASVAVHQLEHDLQNDYYVCRRSADELW